ncbi:MAG: C40 family peptidase [Candidatus Adiutrix sp.]|jgi:cell wall-associated NlpC family hydrolase|nr:C40 family peptidase [Candidatus Adiutrix sp.]
MTAPDAPAQSGCRWLSSIRYKGRAALQGLAAICSVLTLSACLASTTTSSASYSQNLSSAEKAAPAAENTPAAAPDASVAVAAAEPVAVAATEPAAAPAAASEESVIDQRLCTQGLQGDLATGQAGLALLLANGLGGEETAAEGPGPDRLTPGALLAASSPAPSAGAVESLPSAPLSISLNLSAGATEALLIAAYQQTGRHYKVGGISPATGFDSSGFTRWVYGQRGINLPRDVKQQIAGGRLVSKEELRPGDLLIYRDLTNKSENYHVGIYTGQGNFLHAAAKAGVVTETAAFGPQYSPYFLGGRRYYDDPQAAPLSDAQKMAAASSAVKLALAELGPDDKLDRRISSPKRSNSGKKK